MSGSSSQPLRPLHPGWLVPMTLVAGLVATGPAAGVALHRYGYRKLARLLGPALGVLGLAFLAFAILWRTNWYWAALTLTGLHLVSGTTLFLGLRGPHRTYVQQYPPLPRDRGTYREILAGMVGGTVLGGLLGAAGMVGYLLLMDWLISTSFPVIFDDSYAASRVFSGGFFLALSGGIAGGFVGRFRPHISAEQVILYAWSLVWAHLTWVAAVEVLIAIPGFQAGAATGAGWQAVMAPLILGSFLIGTWWPVFLLFFMISPPTRRARLARAGLVVGINIAAGATLSISLGHTSDVFLALGRHFERTASPSQALRSYELGLRKQPNEQVASYLQYRVALLSHKLGQPQKAERGFRRVVAKYTANEALVKNANQFLENLSRGEGRKRVVLPGAETRTEYKSAYCAPNSLALAMGFWGAQVSAHTLGQRITGLSSGTYAVNQKWFAEQEGFRHEFLPLASLDDVKQAVNAGFPVLVYVPAHVFVIIGYDEGLETFVTYDVATQDVWVEYLQQDFIKAWKKQATTLVLVYPPDKENLIPAGLRERMHHLSDDYLHFQLHYFNAPTGSVSVPHLKRAAGKTGELFFPLTILYSDFPGLRKELDATYDPELIAARIDTYFSNDFDEGVHLWGQQHNKKWGSQDWALTYAFQYLIGQRRFDLVRKLANRIDEEGKLTDEALADVGIIELAQGELRAGLDRLERADESDRSLYAGLALAKLGDTQGAVRKLVATMARRSCGCTDPSNDGFFADSKSELALDQYGFPAMAVANEILAGTHDYGESLESLEEGWDTWLHRIPFDTGVALALSKLHARRLANLDPKKNAAEYERLERKLLLARARAERYDRARF
jgi:Peptidase_C39 like family